ncbi:MAG: hypothetical protein EBR95_10725 [Verrucomicrobia bacterium]|nr:hypothetical protein [Verrucomicrobiota bacterium]
MAFRADIFWKSACGRCPDCGAPIRAADDKTGCFARLWDTPTHCAGCGMTLRRKEGFFLGAIVWNYGLTAFGVLPLVLAAYRLGWLDGAWAVRLAVAAIFVVPPLIHAFAWRLWVGTYYGFLPDQLPSGGRRLDD